MNTIKKITLAVFCALLLVSVVAPPAAAQTTMTSTTLSAAIDATQKSFAVASATNINAPGFPSSQGGIGSSTTPAALTLLVVDAEAMEVVSISSTTVTVRRGRQGTQAFPHPASAKVWVGPSSAFYRYEPMSGSKCTATSLPYLPAVVIPSGNVYNCGNSMWASFGSFQHRLTVGAQLTQAATITPTNPIHHITGATTTITTITVPPALPATGGCIILIPDVAMTGMTTSTGGNIALATTAVAKKALSMCWDPVAALWYPSY
jgi:hypothetical protein